MASLQLNRPAHAEHENKHSQSLVQSQRHDDLNSLRGTKSRKTSTSKKITSSQSSQQNGGVSGEEQSNDEEDNSLDGDVEDDEADEPEVIAPSRGVDLEDQNGLVDSTVNGKNNMNDNSHGTGPNSDALLAVPITPSKKRRLSTMSNASILDMSADEGPTPHSFPRKKKNRTLSNDPHGLLTYSSIIQAAEASDVADIAVESSDEDDDDIYQAVNLISDDEEDDPDVEKLEEEVIMSTESGLGHDSLFGGIAGDIFDGMGGNLFGTPDRQLGQLSDFPFGDVERPQAATKGAEARKYSNGSTKRVRFWDEQSADEDSSSTSSDLDAMFPDIFAEQDRLPPVLQQLIENDTDGDLGNQSGSDGEHSYWDFSDNDQTSPSRGPLHEDVDDDNDSTSSGYDSDEGETTDEEFPPPATIRSAKTLLHRSPSSDSDRTASPQKPFRRSKSKPAKGGGPRWGHFSVDPSKATAFTDRSGRRVIVHPPQIPNAHSRFFPGSSASSTANSPRTSLMAAPGEESDLGELTPQNVTNPRDIMFGGIFGMPQDVGNLLKGNVIGPPEAFFPFISLDGNGNPIMDEADEYSEDEDDMDEDDIDLNSFLALPDGMEDDDLLDTPSHAPPDSDFAAGQSDCPESTPIQRTRTVGETMLEHFDRTPGVVSSFRSNQDKYRKIASQHPNPDFRAAGSQAVRFGKSAETPITPVRKRGALGRRKLSKIESPLMRHSSARRTGPRMGTFT